MKTNRIILSVALCLVIGVAAILLKQYRLPITERETSDNVHASSTSNSVSVATNISAKVNDKTNVGGDEGYSQKIIDPGTGLCATVGLDKQAVILKDKNGHVIWTVNMTNHINELSIHIDSLSFDGQIEGKPRRLHLIVRNGMKIGYSPFDIDLDTGNVTGGGGMHIP